MSTKASLLILGVLNAVSLVCIYRLRKQHLAEKVQTNKSLYLLACAVENVERNVVNLSKENYEVRRQNEHLLGKLRQLR